MLNVSYNFYYHLNKNFPKEKICEYIEKHNFESFIKEFNKWGRMYLPSDAFAYADDDERMVTVDITNELNFNEITHCEYECG